jgi:Fic family protein
MGTFIIFVLGVLIGYYFAKDKFAPQGETKQPDQNAIYQKQVEEKKAHLDWILGHFGHEDEITNDRVEKLLGVSDATAERYLNELEKQGKLRQQGTVGRFVTYKKT